MATSRPSTPPPARQTRQREAIAGAIHEASGPLTIRQIHDAARARSARLGLATVYRAVRRLLDEGRLEAVNLPDGETRYEAAHLGHHHHFRCRGCDHVFDLAVCPLSIPRGTTLPGGFRVDDHELTLYGLCPGCRPAAAG